MPLPFQPKNMADVPIVGQPMKIAGFTLNCFFVCNCGNPQPLIVTLVNSMASSTPEGRSAAICSSCGKKWQVGPKTTIALDLAVQVTNAEAPALTAPAGTA